MGLLAFCHAATAQDKGNEDAVGARRSSFFDDPFKVDRLTAPAPNQPWVPDRALPEVPAPVRARLDELKGPVSLALLTDIALELNARTRQAWLVARAEAAQVGVDRAGDFPVVNGTYNYRIGRPISGTSGLPNATRIDANGDPVAAPRGTPFTVFTQYGPNVSINYVLYDSGKRALDKEATGYRLLAANLAQNRSMQEVVFQVEQAYYRVLGLDGLVRASRESLKNFETALDAARRRHQSGLATIADVFRAETQVGQAGLVLSRNEGELSKARGLLAVTVGLPVEFPLALPAAGELPPVAQVTRSMDELLSQAKAARPDLVAAEARVRAARATAQAASKAGLPVLEANAQYGRANFTNALTGQDIYSFALNLRIPIFSGFADTYSVRRAQEVARQAETVRDQLYNQTELDVWQAYYDLQTAATSIESSAKLVNSANQSAVAAAARYATGVGTLLDVITSQTDDTNARIQEVQTRLDWYQALARLNFALGATEGVVSKGKAR